MNEVQTCLAKLRDKGWTWAAIADELGVTKNAVEKWVAGDRVPTNRKSLLEHLDRLLQRQRVPKKRRYLRNTTRQNTLQDGTANPYGFSNTLQDNDVRGGEPTKSVPQAGE